MSADGRIPSQSRANEDTSDEDRYNNRLESTVDSRYSEGFDENRFNSTADSGFNSTVSRRFNSVSDNGINPMNSMDRRANPDGRMNPHMDGRANQDGRMNPQMDGRANSDGRMNSQMDGRFNNSEYEVLDRPVDVDMEDDHRCKYSINLRLCSFHLSKSFVHLVLFLNKIWLINNLVVFYVQIMLTLKFITLRFFRKS